MDPAAEARRAISTVVFVCVVVVSHIFSFVHYDVDDGEVRSVEGESEEAAQTSEEGAFVDVA